MPIRRTPGVLSDEIGGTAFLLGPAGTHVIELNALGAVVWDAIDDDQEVAGIVERVLTKVKPDTVPAQQVEADVRAFLAELTRLELIQP
jgi:hypothetical protein